MPTSERSGMYVSHAFEGGPNRSGDFDSTEVRSGRGRERAPSFLLYTDLVQTVDRSEIVHCLVEDHVVVRIHGNAVLGVDVVHHLNVDRM